MIKPIPIREVDWGIANHFGEYIEIHKDLKYYPHLYEPILAHELSHTTKKGFTWKDLWVDLKINRDINRKDFYLFMLKRPKTWIQFLPFYYQKGKGFIFDANKTILTAVLLLLLTLNVALLRTLFTWL